jgi:hypothetical protein
VEWLMTLTSIRSVVEFRRGINGIMNNVSKFHVPPKGAPLYGEGMADTLTYSPLTSG